MLKDKQNHGLKRPGKHQTRFMRQMVEFSDTKFKITLINMLRAQMEKVDNIQEHMG